ncbi:unnamed protein product [Pieris macdunnoughi]|uniref:Uncharacterized protein n=1 Tax=Pieris macdunnoughi TaxID=345717 RepID=A0A821T6Y0_9NEOP|nr:unnamed protein product [Pieris macdunnoughi]
MRISIGVGHVLVSDNVEHNPFMEFSKQIMEKNEGCLERFACVSSQQKHDMQYLKTMKRILRNELLSSILNTTALEEASNRGLRGYDCLGYEPCALMKEDFITIMENLAAYQKPNKT